MHPPPGAKPNRAAPMTHNTSRRSCTILETIYEDSFHQNLDLNIHQQQQQKLQLSSRDDQVLLHTLQQCWYGVMDGCWPPLLLPNQLCRHWTDRASLSHHKQQQQQQWGPNIEVPCERLMCQPGLGALRSHAARQCRQGHQVQRLVCLSMCMLVGLLLLLAIAMQPALITGQAPGGYSAQTALAIQHSRFSNLWHIQHSKQGSGIYWYPVPSGASKRNQHSSRSSVGGCKQNLQSANSRHAGAIKSAATAISRHHTVSVRGGGSTSRRLLQQPTSASMETTPSTAAAAVTSPKGSSEPNTAAALQTLAADADAASAVVLRAVPNIWVQRYQRVGATLTTKKAPPQQQQQQQQRNLAISAVQPALQAAAPASSLVKQQQLTSPQQQQRQQPSSSNRGPAGAVPNYTAATPAGSSSSSSGSSNSGIPVVTYTGPLDSSLTIPSSGSSSNAGGGISISTSTPVTVINPINVTTPLQQTTVQQSGPAGGLLGGGVGEALVMAAALRPRLVVVPVILPAG